MPNYIEVEQIETPTCGQGDDCELNDNAAHHVTVKIGPAILRPFLAAVKAADALLGTLSDKEVREHDRTMDGHEPRSCVVCSARAAVKAGRKTLKAITGKPL